MKNLIRYLFINLLLIGALIAQEKPVENAPVNTDYKQAFMQLIYDKAVKYSDAGEMAVEKSVDFVMKEAEPTFREYVTWSIIGHLWDGLPWIIAFTTGFLTIIILFSFFSKDVLQDREFKKHHAFLIISAIMTLIGFMGTFGGGPHKNDTSALTDMKLAAQCYFAPRIYVINSASEYIKDLNK